MAKKTARTAPRRPPRAQRERAARVYNTLLDTYPDATCALTHHNPYELLVATILSAQCTDERVNMVTPALFGKYPTPADLAAAKQADVEKLIHSTGFYRNKAKALIAAARGIVNDHDGRVPDTMDELLALRGVARKTANVVLGNAYGVNVGVVVDTHVKRLAHRLGFTRQTAPDKVERDLMALFPAEQWTMLAHLLIWHGRAICNARKPACDRCPVYDDCPRRGLTP